MGPFNNYVTPIFDILTHPPPSPIVTLRNILRWASDTPTPSMIFCHDFGKWPPRRYVLIECSHTRRAWNQGNLSQSTNNKATTVMYCRFSTKSIYRFKLSETLLNWTRHFLNWTKHFQVERDTRNPASYCPPAENWPFSVEKSKNGWTEKALPKPHNLTYTLRFHCIYSNPF